MIIIIVIILATSIVIIIVITFTAIIVIIIAIILTTIVDIIIAILIIVSLSSLLKHLWPTRSQSLAPLGCHVLLPNGSYARTDQGIASRCHAS